MQNFVMAIIVDEKLKRC